ncbi:group III truncated hemoglobin [Helicobacter turcicus]|uniref:Group III truncated hemoglobin n=1 Tax=Helicobacter turcicus TaxID=2867412 RepID=A0ABS7JPU7_9HELI|nr:group III truncated hemoglobin [Helicobacter turcicus]MBX7491439.1 group III truncated hemoglobin [Helicobacter turcicus]MBX7545899.1 group III truncated hemoglobin [Helicobacter turcicus]
MQKYDVICKEGIDVLMDVFYARIRADKNGVGEIFNNVVGKSDEVWNLHKSKISNFWQGMLLGEGNYAGVPLKAHLDLPPFPREYFKIWLDLFDESLKEVFNDKIASEILQRAQMIAQRFQFMLYENKH